MNLNILLIFCSLVILNSCIGQHSTKNNTSNTKIVLGESVTELSKSLWIVFQAANGDYWYGSDTDGAFRVNITLKRKFKRFKL
jgi:hypothetical protein